jgi:hypothetical protein
MYGKLAIRLDGGENYSLRSVLTAQSGSCVQEKHSDTRGFPRADREQPAPSLTPTDRIVRASDVRRIDALTQRLCLFDQFARKLEAALEAEVEDTKG